MSGTWFSAAMLARNDAVSLATERRIEASLRFATGGGRTVLVHQHVPYPFHVTRAFHLDPSRPDLATLYLQSASGGLYRGDQLVLDIDVASGAAAHVTTQAATVVHDTRERAAAQLTRLRVAAGSFAAVVPEALVLFPGAAIESRIAVKLEAGARAIVAEGFAHHDPAGEDRPFARAALSTTVRDGNDRVVLSDRGAISGSEFFSAASPAGAFRATGTLFALGPGAEGLDAAALEHRLSAAGCLAGVTTAPHDLGLAVRILAPDGGALARGLDVAFATAFEALLGFPPARRRK
jgi:urease accessory protein